MIAVQNWYYNLFAAYVRECEQKLSAGEALRSLSQFETDKKVLKKIEPHHPAFSFALFIVALTSVWFLIPIIDRLGRPINYWPFQGHRLWAILAVYLLYATVFIALFNKLAKLYLSVDCQSSTRLLSVTLSPSKLHAPFLRAQIIQAKISLACKNRAA